MAVRVKLTGMALVLLASVILAWARGLPWHWLVCAALGFSWLGDAMLGYYPPVIGKIRDPFVTGMGMFSLAQITYTIAFGISLSQMPQRHMRLPGAILGADIIGSLLPVYLLAGVFFWAVTALKSKRPWPLKIAALVYAELVCIMAAYACAAAFTGTTFVWPLILGGLLFIASDGVIALRIFQERFPNDLRYEIAVWVTYVPAQLCLLLGAFWLF